MNSWKEVLQVLDHELKVADHARAIRQEMNMQTQPDREERRKQMLKSESKLRKGVDLACQEFALNRQWPILEPELAERIFDRLVYGRKLVSWLELWTTGPLSSAATIPLERVLVAGWHVFGYWQWSEGLKGAADDPGRWQKLD